MVTDLPTICVVAAEIGDLIEFLSGLRLISLCCVIFELVEDISFGALGAVPFYRHSSSGFRVSVCFLILAFVTVIGPNSTFPSFLGSFPITVNFSC